MVNDILISIKLIPLDLSLSSGWHPISAFLRLIMTHLPFFKGYLRKKKKSLLERSTGQRHRSRGNYDTYVCILLILITYKIELAMDGDGGRAIY